MGVFDEIYDKTKYVADTVAKKTGEVVENSRLKLKAMKLNSELRSLYEKLGRFVYTMTKEDYENDNLVSSIIEEIDELIKKLDDVNKKIAESSNIIFCNCCGSKNPTDSRYCSKCGNKLVVDFEGYDDIVNDIEEEYELSYPSDEENDD